MPEIDWDKAFSGTTSKPNIDWNEAFTPAPAKQAFMPDEKFGMDAPTNLLEAQMRAVSPVMPFKPTEETGMMDYQEWLKQPDEVRDAQLQKTLDVYAKQKDIDAKAAAAKKPRTYQYIGGIPFPAKPEVATHEAEPLALKGALQVPIFDETVMTGTPLEKFLGGASRAILQGVNTAAFSIPTALMGDLPESKSTPETIAREVMGVAGLVTAPAKVGFGIVDKVLPFVTKIKSTDSLLRVIGKGVLKDTIGLPLAMGLSEAGNIASHPALREEMISNIIADGAKIGAEFGILKQINFPNKIPSFLLRIAGKMAMDWSLEQKTPMDNRDIAEKAKDYAMDVFFLWHGKSPKQELKEAIAKDNIGKLRDYIDKNGFVVAPKNLLLPAPKTESWKVTPEGQAIKPNAPTEPSIKGAPKLGDAFDVGSYEGDIAKQKAIEAKQKDYLDILAEQDRGGFTKQGKVIGFDAETGLPIIDRTSKQSEVMPSEGKGQKGYAKDAERQVQDVVSPQEPSVSPSFQAAPSPLYNADHLDFIKSRVKLGEAGKRQPNAEGEWGGYPSTFPKWFSNKGYVKAEVLRIIDKAKQDKGLTNKQADILDDLIKSSEREYTSSNKQTIKLDELKEGDRFIKDGEEYKHLGFDNEGNAIIKDNITYKIDPFEKSAEIQVDKVLPAKDQFLKPQEASKKATKPIQLDLAGAKTGLEGKLPSEEIKGNTALEQAIEDAKTREAQKGQGDLLKEPAKPRELHTFKVGDVVEINGKKVKIVSNIKDSFGEPQRVSVQPVDKVTKTIKDKTFEMPQKPYDISPFTEIETSKKKTGEITLEMGGMQTAYEAGESLSKRWERAADKVIEKTTQKLPKGFRRFWNPLSTLEGWEDYYGGRLRLAGKQSILGEEVKNMFDKVSSYSPETQQRVYEFLIGERKTLGIPKNKQAEDVINTAQQIKDTIREAGEGLVERGIFGQESFEKLKDKYLPRLYLKHYIEKSSFSGGAKMNLSYSKQRNAKLDKFFRENILGEIKDPALLSTEAIGRELGDANIYDMLENIAHDSRFAFQGQLSPWSTYQEATTMGKKYTKPYQRIYAVPFIKETLGELRAIKDKYPERAKNLDPIIKEGQSIIDNLKRPDMTEGWTQLPNSNRLGSLKGMWVREEIAKDLHEGMFKQLPDTPVMKGLHTMTRWFKIAKVPLNIPTQFRNAFSNSILLDLSGMGYISQAQYLDKAIGEMSKKGALWQQAREWGIFDTTFAQHELIEIRRNFKAMQEGRIDRLVNIGKSGVEWMTNSYQKVEGTFKFMRFLYGIEKEGLTSQKAAIKAQQALFDYSLVSPSIDAIRKSSVLMPFITFQYKVLPQLVETAIKRPWKYAPYIALPFVLLQTTKQTQNITDDDFERLKKLLPDYINKTGVWILPFKRGDKWEFLDFSYYLPWGQYSQLAQDVSNGKLIEGLENFGAFGAPVSQVITAITTGIDPYTNKSLYQPSDTPVNKMTKLMGYIFQLGIPTFLTDKGVAGHLKDYLQDRTDRYGVELPPETVFPRIIGANIYPISEKEAMQMKNIKARKQYKDLKSEAFRNRADKSLMPDEQEEKSLKIQRALYKLRQEREDNE